ncbi:AAL126Cp [Eremothecium gossypii ATCC 10895]|uniref:AAL126Cp n=1 Tax=Eremothecium gossypii (strain ATCC 10895 / CBS 109.51 / FGSC 9923 / NRRL Y-1056) TaxID=284811 RepID=Q75F54_EREGS|nr:AAL126Cp [Eremothecium gossypii ATCC 10895]AAS50240.2 AAL126Cp [Eremothecium gossypii ATCC 10895]AEY94525.1 FAAL126Cp [Eremothecium gossypii FDAG1]
MGLWIIFELAVTVVICCWTTNWLIQHVILDAKRDLQKAALAEQASIAPVRKEGETAIYRNMLVPMGFPLTTGLNLSRGYQFRRGNFGDIWSAAVAVGKGENYICFADGMRWTVGTVNHAAKQLRAYFMQEKLAHVGIVPSVSTRGGFICAIAAFMASLDGGVAHFLPAVPRKDRALDVLVIDSWEIAARLNGSENWYKRIIVCDHSAKPPGLPANLISLHELIDDKESDDTFKYECTDDTDDNKEFLRISNVSMETTSYLQGSLVSSVANFIKTFPMAQSLSERDKLTVVLDQLEESLALQIWSKLFAVLLHGSSISFVKASDLRTISSSTTLLVVSGQAQGIKDLVSTQLQKCNRFMFSWAISLLSEGVFSGCARISTNFANLRCVYIMNEVACARHLNFFPEEIPQRESTDVRRLTRIQLNQIRALLGARVVMELYAPYTIMGPIAQTNIYDYRIFPALVDATFTCYGTLSTSLEGKLVDSAANPDLSSAKRQGLLVVRGFTIGKPLEQERLDRAMKLVQNFHGGEGWTPLVGVFGIWGSDGCFYEFK